MEKESGKDLKNEEHYLGEFGFTITRKFLWDYFYKYLMRKLQKDLNCVRGREEDWYFSFEDYFRSVDRDYFWRIIFSWDYLLGDPWIFSTE
jgi:hypothetical protein